jgi:hypothetical protein
MLVRDARWGLLWLGVLAISVTVAYAMTVAMVSRPSASDAPTPITLAQAPAEALPTGEPEESAGTSAAFDRFSSDEACDTSGGRLGL